MIRLVTLDLDGTLLPRDTAFGVILREHGKADLVREIDAGYAAGRLTNEECFKRQWAEVRRLSLQECHRALRKAAWLPGIGEGVARLHEAGLRVCLLTDQPSTIADFLGRWGLSDPICSPVAVKEGAVVSLDAKMDKLANLEHRLGEWNMQLSEVCHVGNGPNDIPVFGAVGASIAVYDDAALGAAAKRVLPAPKSFADIVSAVSQVMESSVKSPQTR